MNCPRCQMPLANPHEMYCPRCGFPLQPPSVALAGAPAVAAGPGWPQPPAWFAPDSSAPPSGNLTGPGPGAPSNAPFYPSQPYAPYAGFGAAAPGTIPLGQPAWAPAVPPKRRNYAVIAVVVLLLIALVAGGGATVYVVAHGQHGAVASGAANPTATPIYIPLIQDPLTSNAYGWANDSHCFFSSGSYHVKDGYICYAPVQELTNGMVSVQVTKVSGPPGWFFGLVFRRVSKGNYYVLFIDSVGDWKFSKFVNDARTDVLPFVSTSALHRGLHVSNTLQVRISGTHFEFSLNNVQVGQTDDSTFSSGYVGVEGNPRVEVAFNNFDALIVE